MMTTAFRGATLSLVLSLTLFTTGAGAAQWPDLERPARSPSPEGNKDAAIVIAIEDYMVAPDIPGALSNGRAWYNWLVDTRKTPTVKALYNQEATKEAMLQAVEQVASRVQPGGRLWVVYIGHGAPSEGTGDGLLIGVDAQQTPMSLTARGLPRGELLAAAEASLPAGAHVVMIQDACFSGSTQSGDLAPGMAPLKVVKAGLGGSTTVLAAAKGNQYAGPLSDSSKPAFSYLVLGALRGWGDNNRDGLVSAAEAVAYAENAMVVTINGRAQTPELEGRDVPLGRSAKEKAPDLAAFSRDATTPAPKATVAAPPPTTGAGSEFAALAAQAAAAQAAREQAEAAALALSAQLEADRLARTARATAELQAAARRDFEAIAPLVNTPSKEAEAVLNAWFARYGHASVEVDGQRVAVVVAEAAKVEAAIKKLKREIEHEGGAQPEAREPRRAAVTTIDPAAGSGKRGSSRRDTKEAPASPEGCALPAVLEDHTRSGFRLTGTDGRVYNLERGKDRARFRTALLGCGLDVAVPHLDNFDRELRRAQGLYFIPIAGIFLAAPDVRRGIASYTLMLRTLEGHGHASFWPGAPSRYASSTLANSMDTQLQRMDPGRGKAEQDSTAERPPRDSATNTRRERKKKNHPPSEPQVKANFWDKLRARRSR